MTFCEDLSDPFNGQIKFANDNDSKAPFVVGTTATYSCDVGFELQGGNTVRTCEGNETSRCGTWSGMTPICVGESFSACPLISLASNCVSS